MEIKLYDIYKTNIIGCLQSAEPVVNIIMGCIEKHEPIVINFESIDFVDSSFMYELVSLIYTKLVLFNHMSWSVSMTAQSAIDKLNK